MLSSNISVIIPVVRPESAERCADSVRKHLPGVEIVSLDDHDRVGCPKMVNILTREATREWIMFLGDDTEVEPGMLDALQKAVERLPDGWGVIGLNTEPDNSKAHWMAHRRMLGLLPDGVFFPEDYRHCYCDNELFDIANDHGRWVLAEDAKVQHHHPINGGRFDEFYSSVYDDETKIHDRTTYYKRKRARKGDLLAIGFPLVDETVPVQFFTSFACMDKPESYMLLVPKFAHGPWTGSIAEARNSLVGQALEEGASRLLMLDTDQVYPADTLTKLISHGVDICGVRVHRRWPPYAPVFYRGELGSYEYVPDEEMYSGDLIEVDATGTGCLLFDMGVFDRVQPPWFTFSEVNGKPVGEDIHFCHKARKTGVQIFVDTSIEVGHLVTMTVNKTLHQLCKHMKMEGKING